MPKIAVLRVVSKSASFRRAGFQFGTEATDLPLSGLSKAQREAIEADSALVAFETEIDAPDESSTEDSVSKVASKAKK